MYEKRNNHFKRRRGALFSSVNSNTGVKVRKHVKIEKKHV